MLASGLVQHRLRGISGLGARMLAAFSAFAASSALASVTLAQSVIIAGQVTSAGQPLGAASVSITELGLSTRSAVDGRYSITVSLATNAGRDVTLVARAIGYSPKQARVTLAVGAVDRDFALDKDIHNLDQIVVTGVGGETSQRKTAFAVGVVDAAQIQEAPASSPASALAGRVAGVSILTVSGEPGRAPAIRLRSSTSLTGSVAPLIIIDGTITRQSLADINSEDVERMEVIKGAAASSLYGSDAANGVVQIFTKRGAQLAEGQTVFTLRNEFGQSWLPKKVPGNMSHPYQLDGAGAFVLDLNGNRVLEADGISDNVYSVYYDQLDQVFRPGTFMTNYASVGQKRGATNYNISFHNSAEGGVLALLDGFSRQNFRLNLDQSLSESVDFSAGAFYGRSHSEEGQATGMFFGLRYLEPNVNLRAPNADGSPYNALVRQPPLSPNVSNPLYTLANKPVTSDRDRFNGNFKATYRPRSWLTAEGNVNYEQSASAYKIFEPRGFLNSSGASSSGNLRQGSKIDRASNVGATLASVRETKWFTNTTKLAYLFEDQVSNYVEIYAAALTVPRVPEFGAADPSQTLNPGSRTVTIRNQNLFAITTFDIKDKYILDGLIRQDASSLFGADARTATYSRVSAVWRVSEDFTLPGVDEFKLRASYGTAGLRPVFEAQYEAYTLAGGTLRGETVGNRQLRPAFSKETEIGFNLNFLRNYSFEYSLSKKSTSDQILLIPVSAATGFEDRWGNAGTLAGTTHEFAVGAVLMSTGERFWRLNITADRTRQRITELNVAPFEVGFFRVAEGAPLGIIFGDKWIRSAAQLAETIGSGQLPGVAADYERNEEGYFVASATKGTILERPLKAFLADGTSRQQIADVNPDLNLAVNSSFQWKGLAINALVGIVRGGDIYNFTRWAPFNEGRDPAFDQRRKPTAERKPVDYYQVFFNGGSGSSSYFVEDGSYIRLRELAVNWQLPKAWVGRIPMLDFTSARLGIVGRNLWTSTRYSGYDPDVTNDRENPFTYRVDNFSYPQHRTFTLMLELGF